MSDQRIATITIHPSDDVDRPHVTTACEYPHGTYGSSGSWVNVAKHQQALEADGWTVVLRSA